VHEASEVRKAEIHTAEPLVPEPSALEIELAIEKLKSHKSPGSDQIPAGLIKAGGWTIHCCNNPYLKARIIRAVKYIDAPMLMKGWQELEYRIDVCRVTRGAHIEHL
jgi:hypothetical protein